MVGYVVVDEGIGIAGMMKRCEYEMLFQRKKLTRNETLCISFIKARLPNFSKRS
jgi:hypothetical protein